MAHGTALHPARWIRLATRYGRSTYTLGMIRWFLVVFLALMFISWLSPMLRQMGFGRLPGDFRFKWLGRDWDVPLASTLLLSFVVSLLVKWL